MPTLMEAFEQATQDAQQLPERPDNATLLRLYGLYKQATAGDNTAAKPGFFDFVGTAKYEAWARLRGTEREVAMRQYVDFVNELRN